MNRILDTLIDTVRRAGHDKRPLQVLGGGSKTWYGREVDGDCETLSLAEYCGIVDYEPTELVITARCGTRLSEIEAVLADRGQMLAFEPPVASGTATLGGIIACGLSGPRRPYAGAARDFVLGASLLDGRGEILRFGGKVMKNVAGYDMARALCGSLGILGAILEVSLKVLPRPRCERTLVFECSQADALRRLNEWGAQPLPVSASAWHDGLLRLRVSGEALAVDGVLARLGGERVDEATAAAYWRDLCEHRPGSWFGAAAAERSSGPVTAPLWRVSLPSTAPVLHCGESVCVEWGGALRWLYSDLHAQDLRERVAALGGTAMMYHGGDRRAQVFDNPGVAAMTIHRRLKDSFDPHRIFNPGRMYPEL